MRIIPYPRLVSLVTARDVMTYLAWRGWYSWYRAAQKFSRFGFFNYILWEKRVCYDRKQQLKKVENETSIHLILEDIVRLALLLVSPPH